MACRDGRAEGHCREAWGDGISLLRVNRVSRGDGGRGGLRGVVGLSSRPIVSKQIGARSESWKMPSQPKLAAG